MRYAIDPRQMSLFDPASTMFSPMTLKYLSSDWPGVFRHQMLHLMPAEALGKHFSQVLGCPTKELYGMAGAMATFGRTKLMGVTIKRFLVQFKRHHAELYAALDQAMQPTTATRVRAIRRKSPRRVVRTTKSS